MHADAATKGSLSLGRLDCLRRSTVQAGVIGCRLSNQL